MKLFIYISVLALLALNISVDKNGLREGGHGTGNGGGTNPVRHSKS